MASENDPPTTKRRLKLPIPKNITRQNIIDAIEKDIDHLGWSPRNNSTTYDVLYKGKRYPPKIVVMYANKYANGELFDVNHFSGGEATTNRFFRARGFTIVPKEEQEIKNNNSSLVTTTNNEIILKPGVTLGNTQLRALFKCSPRGGMRRGTRTNSLVLISDHTKTLYEDIWKGEVLHYTGMGLTGDQSLTFQQNKTLAASTENGVQLHLFEVYEEGKYVYTGEVELVGSPYQKKQVDMNNQIRNVFIFPLKVKGTERPPLLPKELLDKKEELVQKKVHKLSLEELANLVKNSPSESGTRQVITEVRERSPLLKEYTKRLANGICHLCSQPAPFIDRYGDPFLETHHIHPLAEGGLDIIENIAALCPNCHRKMHALNLPGDVDMLKKKVISKF